MKSKINTFTKFKNLPKSNYQYLFTFLLCFILVFIFCYYSIDPDFGWHLQAGNYILKNGVPKLDVFTYTANNFPWINHEWLNDVLISILYKNGGYLLVAFSFCTLWLSGLVLSQRKWLKFPLLLATIAVLPFSGIRPVAWTVLFIATLERLISSKNKKWHYTIPLLFILWANLHGSFVLGLLILLIYQLFTNKKINWLLIIASFAAVLINPYGIKIFEEIIRTGKDTQLRFRISEWRPVLLPYISVGYVVITVALAASLNKKPLKLLISLPALALAMTISSIRHLPIFVTTSLRYLEKFQIDLIKKLKQTENSKDIQIIKTVSLLILWGFIVILVMANIRMAMFSKGRYPINSVQYLKNNPCEGNIFNSYNYGGYLIWQLPSSKVYIDGRMPSWEYKGNNYFNDYIKFFDDDSFRQNEIKKYNIKCILISDSQLINNKDKKAKPFITKIQEEGWEIVESASADEYFLLKKN